MTTCAPRCATWPENLLMVMVQLSGDTRGCPRALRAGDRRAEGSMFADDSGNYADDVARNPRRALAILSRVRDSSLPESRRSNHNAMLTFR
jgi:hypothetical protein